MSWTIATWNVNSLKARKGHVLSWLEKNPVDILALQELKTLEFEVEEFVKLGYNVNYVGQKAYNGVAIISRVAPTMRPVKFLVHAPDNQARFLSLEFANTSVICVYVPNGSQVDSEKYIYKLAWLDALNAWLGAKLQNGKDLVVLGDFNIAPTVADTHDPSFWEGKLLTSAAERLRYNDLLALGLYDLYDVAISDNLSNMDNKRFTWWDYRAQAFKRGHGLRIDLILATHSLSQLLEKFDIDSGPRAWDKASDHCPVLASFAGDL